jgi:hypothetical protein
MPLLGAVALSALVGCSSVQEGNGRFAKKETAQTVSFERQIRPFLESRCLSCHHGDKASRQLSLETLEKANSTWRGGPVIVARSPMRSMLFQVLELDTDGDESNLSGHAISFAERETIITWIREGADWPASTAPLQPR